MNKEKFKKAAVLTASVAGLAATAGFVTNQPAVQADTTQAATINQSTDNQNLVTMAQNKVTAAQSAVVAASAAVTSAEAANSVAQAKVTTTRAAADASQTSAVVQVSFLKSGDQGQETNKPSEMSHMFSSSADIKTDETAVNVTIHSTNMAHMISNFHLENENLDFVKVNQDSTKDTADWQVSLAKNADLPTAAATSYLLGMTINTGVPGMPTMNEKAYLKIIYPQRIMEAVAEIRAYEAALLAADKAAETLTNAKNALEVANEALSKAQGALKAAEALAKEASQPTEPQNDNSQTPTTPPANGGETTPTKNSRPSGNDKATSQSSMNNGTKTDNWVQPTTTTASTKKVKLATPKAVIATQVSTTKGATLPQTGNEKSGLALLGLALMSMLVMPVKRLVK